MKITVSNDMKQALTMAEIDAVKVIQESMREQKNFQWEAEAALTLAAGENMRKDDVMKITVDVIKNRRIWDYYGDGSGMLDVHISAIGYSAFSGFYIVCFCLSDIWSLASDNREEIKNRMYIQHFTRDIDCDIW